MRNAREFEDGRLHHRNDNPTARSLLEYVDKIARHDRRQYVSILAAKPDVVGAPKRPSARPPARQK